MRQRGVDGGTPIGAPHLSGCEREACLWCGGVLMACSGVLCLLPEAGQVRCGSDVCFLPEQRWGPLQAGKRQPSPWPPRRPASCRRARPAATCRPRQARPAPPAP